MEIIKPDIKKALKAIKEGKVLVCPTDTVYGLVCDAANKKAVEKLYKIKKRPRNKPIPIFVKDIKMAKKLAHINKEQEKFLKKVWFTRPNFSKDAQKKMVKIGPKIWAGKGKVTVVLKSKNKGTIGLRIPNHKFVLSLAKHVGPLAESSANISGRPASTKIKEVLRQFTPRRGSGQENQKYKPDLVIDDGDLPPSKPSTVIDLTISSPKILRP